MPNIFETIRDNNAETFNGLATRQNVNLAVFRNLTASQVAARYGRITIARNIIALGGDTKLVVGNQYSHQLLQQEAKQSAMDIAKQHGHVKFAHFLRCCELADEKQEMVTEDDMRALLIAAVHYGNVGLLEQVKNNFVTETVGDKAIGLAGVENPKAVLHKRLQTTLNNLLILAAENNNAVIFRQLLEMGAKLIHDHSRRSAYYYAYKFNNQKIIQLIQGEVNSKNLSAKDLYQLQLNTLHYYNKDSSNKKRKKVLYKQLSDHATLDADMQDYDKAVEVIPASILDPKDLKYYTAASIGNEIYLEMATFEPDSFRRVFNHALENEDYVTLSYMFVYAGSRNKLIDEIVDGNDEKLLTILLFVSFEPLDYCQQLIQRAANAVVKKPISASAASSGGDAKVEATPMARLERFLKMGWSLEGLLQNIFAKKDKKLLRQLVYVLVIGKGKSAVLYEPLLDLINRLPGDMQIIFAKQFLLHVQAECVVDLSTVASDTVTMNSLRDQYQVFSSQAKQRDAKDEKNVAVVVKGDETATRMWNAIIACGRAVEVYINITIRPRSTGEKLIISAFQYSRIDGDKQNHFSRYLGGDFNRLVQGRVSKNLNDIFDAKDMQVLRNHKNELNLIKDCLKFMDDKIDSDRSWRRGRAVGIWLTVTAASLISTICVGTGFYAPAHARREEKIDTAYNAFDIQPYQNSTCGAEFPWILSDSDMHISSTIPVTERGQVISYPLCDRGDPTDFHSATYEMASYAFNALSQDPIALQLYNLFINSECSPFAAVLCAALDKYDENRAILSMVFTTAATFIALSTFLFCCVFNYSPNDRCVSSFRYEDINALPENIRQKLRDLNSKFGLALDMDGTIAQFTGALEHRQVELNRLIKEIEDAMPKDQAIVSSVVLARAAKNAGVAALTGSASVTLDIGGDSKQQSVIAAAAAADSSSSPEFWASPVGVVNTGGSGLNRIVLDDKTEEGGLTIPLIAAQSQSTLSGGPS